MVILPQLFRGGSSVRRYLIFSTLTLAAMLSAVRPASAELTLLVGEPYGSFGTMMPVGHASIYLDRVCADGPLKLRMCHAGEPQGVVIARYHRIGQLDWIATPVLQFLFATDDPREIPAYATPEIINAMREHYRLKYMREIVPDGTQKFKGTDEWWESAGMAYNRRLFGYQIDTTVEQDEKLVLVMNADSNHRSYELNTANCADFAATIINLYFPGTVHRNHIADFGWMMPKQVARNLAAFGRANPQAHLRIIEIDQVPGSLRRSRPVRGAAEGLLKTKRYLATLLVIQPEVVPAALALYLDQGRWKLGAGAQLLDASAFVTPLRTGPDTSIAGSGSQEPGPSSTPAKSTNSPAANASSARPTNIYF